MKESLFIKSIKTFNPKLIHTTIIDFIYIVVFFCIGIFSFWLLSLAFGMVWKYWLFIILLILAVIISYALIALNMAFFKNIVWNMTLNKKRKFIGFLKFTSIWFFPWVIVFYLLRNTLPEQLQVFILTAYALIYFHFTIMARLSFEKSVKKAFLKAFDIGFWKFPKFIIPYLLILAAVWVIMGLISFLVYLSETLFFVLSTVAAFVLMAWSRYYISLVYKK